MRPKKYTDFVETTLPMRIAKQNPVDEFDFRKYVSITCPHCQKVIDEVPFDIIDTKKPGICLNHLRGNPTSKPPIPPCKEAAAAGVVAPPRRKRRGPMSDPSADNGSTHMPAETHTPAAETPVIDTAEQSIIPTASDSSAEAPTAPAPTDGVPVAPQDVHYQLLQQQINTNDQSLQQLEESRETNRLLRRQLEESFETNRLLEASRDKWKTEAKKPFRDADCDSVSSSDDSATRQTKTDTLKNTTTEKTRSTAFADVSKAIGHYDKRGPTESAHAHECRVVRGVKRLASECNERQQTIETVAKKLDVKGKPSCTKMVDKIDQLRAAKQKRVTFEALPIHREPGSPEPQASDIDQVREQRDAALKVNKETLKALKKDAASKKNSAKAVKTLASSLPTGPAKEMMKSAIPESSSTTDETWRKTGTVHA